MWEKKTCTVRMPIIKGVRVRLKLFWDMVIRQKPIHISVSISPPGGTVEAYIDEIREVK